MSVAGGASRGAPCRRGFILYHGLSTIPTRSARLFLASIVNGELLILCSP